MSPGSPAPSHGAGEAASAWPPEPSSSLASGAGPVTGSSGTWRPTARNIEARRSSTSLSSTTVSHLLPHVLQAPVDQGLGRPKRASEQLRYLGKRQVVVVAQHEGLALADRQGLEQLPDELVLLVQDGPVWRGCVPELYCAVALSVTDLVDDHLAEIGGGIFEHWPRSRGKPEECVMDDIFGFLFGPGHHPRGPHEAGPVSRVQGRELGAGLGAKFLRGEFHVVIDEHIGAKVARYLAMTRRPR